MRNPLVIAGSVIVLLVVAIGIVFSVPTANAHYTGKATVGSVYYMTKSHTCTMNVVFPDGEQEAHWVGGASEYSQCVAIKVGSSVNLKNGKVVDF